jgi:hypothetical protein
MGVIPTSFAMLQRSYPRRDLKDPALYQYVDQVMKTLPGTPCCVQMSHAFNMAGVTVPPTSYWRKNTALKINGRLLYYLAATDELEDFLVSCCKDDGEMINLDLTKTRSVSEIKKYIANRPGLLLFRYGKFRVPPPPKLFEHTELWDGTKILQRDMAEDSLFAHPRVLMWDTNDPARWLTDYMKTQPSSAS